jgi:hypothetical protein
LYTDCVSFPYRTPPKMIIFFTFLVSTFTEQDHSVPCGGVHRFILFVAKQVRSSFWREWGLLYTKNKTLFLEAVK